MRGWCDGLAFGEPADPASVGPDEGGGEQADDGEEAPGGTDVVRGIEQARQFRRGLAGDLDQLFDCLLYTSPSPRD